MSVEQENIQEAVPSQILKLKKQLHKFQFRREKIYSSFTENYLLPKEFWEKRRLQTLSIDQRIDLGLEAIYHFYYFFTDKEKENFYVIRNLHEQCFYPFNNLAGDYSMDERDEYKIKSGFKYPHKGIKLDLMSYERFCSSPVHNKTIKLVEKMEKLYEKIKYAKTIYEKFEYMMESKNEIFVKQNIEIELCSNLNDKNLWKFYINYLRNIDSEEMLQVYSKYCRYFCDDYKMKEEYKQEVEKIGGVKVLWKNRFEFETESFSSSHSASKLPPPPTTSTTTTILDDDDDEEDFFFGNIDNFDYDDDFPQNDFLNEFNRYRNEDKLNGHFDTYLNTRFQNIIPQKLPFKYSFMKYLMDNLHITLKLQQTCKYFFANDRKLYCYKFKVSINLLHFKFHEASIECNFEESKFPKRFRITTVFELQGPCRNISDFIKKNIDKCFAKYITINSQNLSENEFEFLVGRGNVEDLRLISCEIKNKDDEILKLEEILKYIPKLRILNIENVSLKICNTLSKLKFINKFFIFRIGDIANEINSEDFCEFIKQICIPSSEIRINFEEVIGLQLHLKTAIKVMENDWIPQNEKPNIYCPVWEWED